MRKSHKIRESKVTESGQSNSTDLLSSKLVSANHEGPQTQQQEQPPNLVVDKPAESTKGRGKANTKQDRKPESSQQDDFTSALLKPGRKTGEGRI